MMQVASGSFGALICPEPEASGTWLCPDGTESCCGNYARGLVIYSSPQVAVNLAASQKPSPRSRSDRRPCGRRRYRVKVIGHPELVCGWETRMLRQGDPSYAIPGLPALDAGPVSPGDDCGLVTEMLWSGLIQSAAHTRHGEKSTPVVMS